MKQAKEQAADEIERYRQESERKFKEFEAKVFFFSFKNRKNQNKLFSLITAHGISG